MVFSGIVEGTAVVTNIAKNKGLYNLEIKTPNGFSSSLQIGGSVCVDGVCLTTSSIKGNTLGFDIMMETDDIVDFESYTVGIEKLKKYDVLID